MMKKLLFKIAMELPCKPIHDNGKAYLERYFLSNFLGLRFYLHRFVASDPDRGLHNHPWRWALSLVLFNKYREITGLRIINPTRTVRFFNFITNKTFHRVLIGENEEVWTLFIHPNNYKFEWGFKRKNAAGRTYFTPWKPRHRVEGENKTNWEKTAPKGKDFKRDSRGAIIIEEPIYVK